MYAAANPAFTKRRCRPPKPEVPKWSVNATTISRAEKAHQKKKAHNISENPLDGWVFVGHPAGVPAKMCFSVSFSIVNHRKSLGHRPVYPCLSCRVSQGHPAGVPGIFSSLCACFFPDNLGVAKPEPLRGPLGGFPVKLFRETRQESLATMPSRNAL